MPDNIGGLILLEDLFIYKMPIREFPESIGYLHNLKCLSVIDETKCLEKLTDSFANLTNLETFHLSTPELTALAKEMVGLD